MSLEEKIIKEINKELKALSENNPNGFENAIAIQSRIRTLVKVLTL
tara:strand:+ start:4359 stop:4496 length:138 start_codon:yes stop_codon:yes gene_type:complete